MKNLLFILKFDRGFYQVYMLLLNKILNKHKIVEKVTVLYYSYEFLIDTYGLIIKVNIKEE